MGNCLFRGTSSVTDSTLEVVTANGGILELCGPLTAACITTEFPGHSIFTTQHSFLNPLPPKHVLVPGESYFLLPSTKGGDPPHAHGDVVTPSSGAAPVPKYRITSGRIMRKQREEVKGRWKVKLVISRPQLLHMLSEEAWMEELVLSVNTVAKCGAGFPGKLEWL